VKQRQFYSDIDNQIARARKIYPTYREIPKPLMTQYQQNDVERTMLLFQSMWPLLNEKPRMLQEYYVELELVQATVLLEEHGIMVSRTEAENLVRWLRSELESNHQECVDTLGEWINFGSYPAVTRLLYHTMKFPVVKNDDNTIATDKDAFEELRQYCQTDRQHQVLDMILRHRSYTKGIAMVSSYLKAADGNDIIHPHINTNRAVTGRESSSNPNMQNVSKEVALKTKFPVPARKCFRARPGNVLILCDYAGIEMRLAVQGTGSERLIELLTHDFDFHDACAQSFFGPRYTDQGTCLQFYLTDDHRRQKEYRGLCDRIGREEAATQTYKKAKKMLRSAAKNGRFAMLYGAGLKSVANTLMMSLAEARAGYVRDKSEYPEFYVFMDECTQFAREHGYIETFFGRELRVNPTKPYKATDYSIQGSAAGLFKRAQVRATKWLQENSGARFVLPVHDEFLFEYPRSELSKLNEWKAGITPVLTQFDEITVPLTVEWKMSTYTWDRAKELI
jgi:DNA polymerase-1